MRGSLMDRIRAERRRWLSRLIGLLMVIAGAFEIAGSLIFGTFPEILQHLGQAGPFVHSVIGLVLIIAGGWIHYRNREEF